MSDNIIKIFRNAYKNGFLLEAQQTMSDLQPFVQNESIEGEKWFVDRMLKNTTSSGIYTPTRHSATEFVEYDFQRRTIVPVEHVYSVIVDGIDILKTIQDPKGELVQEGIRRFNRKKDSVLITAALGTALTGVAGGSSTSLPNAQKVTAVSGTGLTKARINNMDEIFNTADVPQEDQKYLVIGPKQLTDLRGITEFTSMDYSMGHPMGGGELPNVLGYNIIVSNLLGTSGSYRQCFAFSRGGLALGIGKDIQTRLDELQAFNYNYGVFARMAIGATRLHEERVVQIDCWET